MAASRRERCRYAGGKGWERTVILREDGAPAMEYWLIDGAGHAWSRGDAAGSYIDPQRPDGSAEMVRFFLAVPKG